MHIPNTLGFCEATTLGLASCTIGLALYRTGDLPAPDRPSDFMDRPTVLVYGGSSATGAMALQLLRLYVEIAFLLAQLRCLLMHETQIRLVTDSYVFAA